jgi:hypothetical protein
MCKQKLGTLVAKHYNAKTIEGAKTTVWITQMHKNP